MMESQGLRILVVDDEKAIRRFLNASLSAHGYKILESVTGKDALRESVSFHPDVILLDLGLPDIDGIKLIQKIRKRAKTPIIILSVREDSSDKIMALDAGADDYLTKPFSIEELLARLRAVMRRLLPIEKESVLHIGRLSVDIPKHRVTADGNEVDLTPTEHDVLKLLVLNVGKVMTHRQILREIWNKSEELDGVLHLLRVTISNLRGKLEPNPDRPTYILTEPGIGYRLQSDS
ncbi:MAG: response regulator transcription factor [Candidatus Omnitrophica bacterium]|nr:response regulator transcription factor [Candidatus Omnitrophota bacterium]